MKILKLGPPRLGPPMFATDDFTITFLGCGTMGTAVLSSILKGDRIPKKIFTVNKSDKARNTLKEKYGDKIVTDLSAEEAIKRSDVLVVGLKPYVTGEVLNSVKDLLPGKFIISLVAGWTIDQFLVYTLKVAKVMTNTPAKFGEGMAGIAVSSEVEENKNHELDLVNRLVSGIGKLIVVAESKMDIVTSLVGSGPAYVLLMIESMIDSGIKKGLTYDDSRTAALQVMSGTAKMLEITGQHPAVLKTQVCTPGGCTIGGLAVMEELGLRTAIIKGVEEGANIAGNLGKK